MPIPKESNGPLACRIVAAVLILFGAAAAFAQATQESPPLAEKQDSQAAPAKATEEAQKPDTKASAGHGDLAKAVQNPVASLISVLVRNLTDFNITPIKGTATLSFSYSRSFHCNPVLDVAKIEAGRITVKIAPCDLGRLIEDVENMMRARASERNSDLRLVQSKRFRSLLKRMRAQTTPDAAQFTGQCRHVLLKRKRYAPR